MITKINEYVLPVTGGTMGSIMASITFGRLVEVVVFSFLGATIGYFSTLLWNKLFKKKKNENINKEDSKQ